MRAHYTENNVSSNESYKQLYVSIIREMNSGNYSEVLPLLAALSKDHAQRVNADYTRFCLANARYHLGLNQFTEAREWLEKTPKKTLQAYHVLNASYLEKRSGLGGGDNKEARVDSILSQAQKLCLESKYAEAYEMYTSHSQLYKNNRLLLAFTQFLISWGRTTEGRNCYNILSNLIYVHRYDMVLLLHHLLRREKKYTNAIHVLDEIPITAGEYRLKAFRACANCYLELNNIEAVHNIFVAALTEFPTDPTLRENALFFAEQYRYEDLLHRLMHTAQSDMFSPLSPTPLRAHGTSKGPSSANQYKGNFMAVINTENARNKHMDNIPNPSLGL